jgi:hypothetical protein
MIRTEIRKTYYWREGRTIYKSEYIIDRFAGKMMSFFEVPNSKRIIKICRNEDEAEKERIDLITGMACP